ncbi:MAG: histidine phosphatase family protein [Alphaproteobacteria bacterium]|nr:histidine phosphatase family protein [Alphaproteobacteria bacterium]
MLLIRHGQSEFNVVFSRTRVDPGIRDPRLTEFGRAQAREIAGELAAYGIGRIIASPYTRAIETALPIAERLGAAIEIDPSVGERAAYFCDIGSSPAELKRRFPMLDFDHLDDPWFHDHETLGRHETEEELARRGAEFRARAAVFPDRSDVLVVTHWGFIRALTGQQVKNAEIVRLQFDD